MVDLALDSDFSVDLNDRNELATVDGRAEFEQSVRVMLTSFMYSSVIGETDTKTIKQKLRLQTSRVARRHSQISYIDSIEIAQAENDPHTYEVRIDYKSDSILQFEVSE